MRNGESGRIGHGRPGKQSGLAYVLLLITVAVLGIVSASSLSIGSKIGKRDAERELLAIGAEFEQALRSYAGFSGNVAATPGGSGPRTLQELLRDPRFPALKRHLRQVYFDPLTGSNEWGIVKNTAGFIVGIYSTAGGTPIQRTGFEAGKPHFENAESYSSWVFGLPTAALPNTQRVGPSLRAP